MAQADTLTDEQVDILLSRFDQTDRKLQRRIIAEMTMRLAKLEQELLDLDARKRMGQADCEEILEEQRTLFNQGAK